MGVRRCSGRLRLAVLIVYEAAFGRERDVLIQSTMFEPCFRSDMQFNAGA